MWDSQNTHMKIDRVYGDDPPTAFEGLSTAGSKMVSAIGDRNADANIQLWVLVILRPTFLAQAERPEK